MAFKIISGTTFRVEADTADAALALFQKHVDGTTTPEEAANITDLDTTGFELQGELDGSIGDGPI